jgi:hypothetical protein
MANHSAYSITLGEVVRSWGAKPKLFLSGSESQNTETGAQ